MEMTPIERYMYDALADASVDCELWHTYGGDLKIIAVEAQVPVGRYRADFAVRFVAYFNLPTDFIGDTWLHKGPEGFEQYELSIYVECDGHDFHEKTKAQARHDKMRDRFFVAEGHIVVRFTGSELYGNARQCAAEVYAIAHTHAGKYAALKGKVLQSQAIALTE